MNNGASAARALGGDERLPIETIRARSRPPEIEEPSNRLIIHPLSRRLATLCIALGLSANTVSVLGVLMMVGTAGCYLQRLWPWGVLAGFACHIAWHIFDGADGEVARRTGTSSTNGEIVDGLCDLAGHIVLCAALAVVLARSLGLVWVVALGVGTLVSRYMQTNFYETARRTYRWWVYGVGWVQNRQADIEAGRNTGWWQRFTAFMVRYYLRASAAISGHGPLVDAAMTRLCASSEEKATQARAIYRRHTLALVKSAALFNLNKQTLAIFASMLVGSPLYFFLYVVFGMNAVLVICGRVRKRTFQRLLGELTELERA